MRDGPRALGVWPGRSHGRPQPLHILISGCICWSLWRMDKVVSVLRRISGICRWPQFKVTSYPIMEWLAHCHTQPEKKKYLCCAFLLKCSDLIRGTDILNRVTFIPNQNSSIINQTQSVQQYIRIFVEQTNNLICQTPDSMAWLSYLHLCIMHLGILKLTVDAITCIIYTRTWTTYK